MKGVAVKAIKESASHDGAAAVGEENTLENRKLRLSSATKSDFGTRLGRAVGGILSGEDARGIASAVARFNELANRHCASRSND